MKYHKKLKRKDLLKYGWKTMLCMAASEFSRAHHLSLSGNSKEMESCLLRAKEILGVLETDPSIPPNSAARLLHIVREMVMLSQVNSKKLYNKSMRLALT